MGEDTKIAWCDHTWNPWLDCDRKAGHPGCVNCYAQDYFRRFDLVGKRRKTSDAYWRQPLKWDKQAEEEGVQRSVFLSMCDPFEDWAGPIVNAKGERLNHGIDNKYIGHAGISALVDSQWTTMNDLRRDFFQLIDQTPNLTWILATKRPENIRRMWVGDTVVSSSGRTHRFAPHRPNVHLLYSASDQASLDAGIGHLLECRDLAPVLGLSLEPLIRPIDIDQYMCSMCEGRPSNPASGYSECPMCEGKSLSWVVCGGESGPNARPCQIEHVDDILRQCEEAGVWCFVKQMGSNAVTSNVNLFDYPRSLYPIDGRDGWKPWGEFAAGARIPFAHPKGGDPAEWPNEMRVQQHPR